jgi:hypothetical protein
MDFVLSSLRMLQEPWERSRRPAASADVSLAAGMRQFNFSKSTGLKLRIYFI